MTIPGWGPGLHHSLKLNGTDSLTFGQLAAFVHAAEQSVPNDAPVELRTESADRPGERNTWSITIAWKEQQ